MVLIQNSKQFDSTCKGKTMNQLIKAMKKEDNKTTTLNGAKAFKSSKNALVDLFGGWGGMRGKDIIPMYANALQEDKTLANKIILWGRDVREGAGERKLFRDALMYLAHNDYKEAIKVLQKVPELGRWDDVVHMFNSPIGEEAKKLVAQNLAKNNNLCAKWMPRKGQNAVALTKYLQLTPKQYRKLLVSLTNVVENKMCAQQWDKINYNHVPSQAARIYSKAFQRHDPIGYTNYKQALIKGEAKINAGAIFPHEILSSLGRQEQIAEAQWKALPDWVPDNLSFLPLIDTSGSMGNWERTGSPANIAISLGLYLSERNKSAFKDTFITFSEYPQLQSVNGNLSAKCKQMSKAAWSMNTNINLAFRLILNTATKHKVSKKDMPTHILIISDMQFDGSWDKTNYNEIKEMYKQSGYDLPKIIFWNVNYYGNMPVKMDKENTALVSGFSPSVMKSILLDKMTPWDQMIETISNPRYNY